MTNLDDSEQNQQKEKEQSMEQEIRSAGNGAFDRSDIMYMMDTKSDQMGVEGKRKLLLEQEVANFKMNSLNKKTGVVIAMKEKRQVTSTPTVFIKKKRNKPSSSNSISIGSSEKISPKVLRKDEEEEDSAANPSRTSTTTSNSSTMKSNSSDNNDTTNKIVLTKKPAGALGGLLDGYSDSDSDS
jgi:hypothetical protein